MYTAGLDLKYSYPALLTFLEMFKRLCESIETFGNPRLKFVYQKHQSIRTIFFPEIGDVEPWSTLTVTL